jgi:hypothetical protein
MCGLLCVGVGVGVGGHNHYYSTCFPRSLFSSSPPFPSHPDAQCRSKPSSSSLRSPPSRSAPAPSPTRYANPLLLRLAWHVLFAQPEFASPHATPPAKQLACQPCWLRLLRGVESQITLADVGSTCAVVMQGRRVSATAHLPPKAPNAAECIIEWDKVVQNSVS